MFCYSISMSEQNKNPFEQEPQVAPQASYEEYENGEGRRAGNGFTSGEGVNEAGEHFFRIQNRQGETTDVVADNFAELVGKLNQAQETPRLLGAQALGGSHLLDAGELSEPSNFTGDLDRAMTLEEVRAIQAEAANPKVIDVDDIPGASASTIVEQPVRAGEAVDLTRTPSNPNSAIGFNPEIPGSLPNASNVNTELLQRLQDRLGELPEGREQ